MTTIQTAEPRKRIYKNILETIGGTPLVEIHGIADHPKISKTTPILEHWLNCLAKFPSTASQIAETKYEMMKNNGAFWIKKTENTRTRILT